MFLPSFSQMLSISAFVVADDSDSSNMSEAQSLGLSLDTNDFSIDGYYVDKDRFPVLGKAVRKGKGRAQEQSEDVEDEEDAPIEDRTPSSSTVNISSEGDDPQSDPLSQTASEAGVGRRLDFPELEITRTNEGRPGSAPELGSGSGRKTGGGRGSGKQVAKRRRVDPPPRQASPLGRPSEVPDITVLLERLEASKEREKSLTKMLEMQQIDINKKVEEALQHALQNMGGAAVFPNAGPVLHNVQPIDSAPPTSRLLQILGSPSGGANLPESEPSIASVSERSHHSTDQDMRDRSPSPPQSPSLTQTQRDGPETSSGPSQT